MPGRPGLGEEGMISCKQVSTLVMSGELERQNAFKRLEIRLHLWMCKYCSRIAGQMEMMGDASRRLRVSFDSDASSDASSTLERRVLARLQNSPSPGNEPLS